MFLHKFYCNIFMELAIKLQEVVERMDACIIKPVVLLKFLPEILA